ncbi:MAG: hypothetical protein KGJ14_05355, partial [Nitrospirota bacterium]|nr:hypothetical protein [Nitrospirota bacterium]
MTRYRTLILLAAWLCAALWLDSPAFAAAAAADEKAKSLPPIPLSLDEVLAWVDRSHPLLKGAGTEKVMARGRM